MCVIGTYVEWLQDPDYDPPVCSICKDPVNEDNVLRLMCLHLFHPECIDVHASSFPPNTAQAGFICPNCPKPIIPPPNATSPLARLILEHIKNAPWLNPVEKMPTGDINKGRVGLLTTESTSGSSSEIAIDISVGEGIASRKSVKVSKVTDVESSHHAFDDDDDKYRKPHLSHMLDLLSKEEPTSSSGKKRGSRFRITTRGILVLFGLFSILATIVFLHRSLSAIP